MASTDLFSSDEHETALHNLNDRLEAEVDGRQASHKALEEAVEKVGQQSTDLVNGLEQKLADTDRSIEETARQTDEKMKNLRDELSGKLQQSANDMEEKMTRQIEAGKDEVTKALADKVRFHLKTLLCGHVAYYI